MLSFGGVLKFCHHLFTLRCRVLAYPRETNAAAPERHHLATIRADFQLWAFVLNDAETN